MTATADRNEPSLDSLQAARQHVVVAEWIPMDWTLFRTYQRLHLAALQKLDQLFQEAGIDYWICDGTLLGAVRHQGLVPHDDDIDVECRQQDLEHLSKLPTDHEYWGFEKGGQWQGFPVYKLRFRGDVSVDVFPRHFPPKDDTEEVEKKYFPTADEIFPLCRFAFENIQVWGPNQADSYLKRLYGNDCLNTVLVWNHDFNYFHSKAFDARRVVVPLQDYNHIIQHAGIESPLAKETAALTYQAAYDNFEGGEETFVRQLQAYKRQRTFRWNRADAEWRYEQQERQETLQRGEEL
jgi:LicD family